MKKHLDREIIDKKELLRKGDRLTRPPRLEGVVHKHSVRPVRKAKKKKGNV